MSASSRRSPVRGLSADDQRRSSVPLQQLNRVGPSYQQVVRRHLGPRRGSRHRPLLLRNLGGDTGRRARHLSRITSIYRRQTSVGGNGDNLGHQARRWPRPLQIRSDRLLPPVHGQPERARRARQTVPDARLDDAAPQMPSGGPSANVTLDPDHALGGTDRRASARISRASRPPLELASAGLNRLAPGAAFTSLGTIPGVELTSGRQRMTPVGRSARR